VLAADRRVDHTPPVRVEVVERLGPLEDAWNGLVATQQLPSPFLASWWLDGAVSGRLRIVCCLEGDRLVGGAAFESDRLGRGRAAVERLRSPGQGELAPDHLDLVADAGREHEVTERVLGWLRRPGSRLVDLDGLAADGRLALGLSRQVIARDVAPYADLSTGADAYLASRPGKLRSTISRTRKRLEKGGAVLRTIPDGPLGEGAEPAVAARVLRTLADLHDERWAAESGFLGAWEDFEAAARAGLERGDVFAVELVSAAGEVVATELDLVAGNRVAFYQAGRSTEHQWRGAGSVVKASVIEAAAARGASEYDLLRGDEPYKADWATGRRQLVRVRFGVGPLGRPLAAGIAAWWRAAPRLEGVRAELARRVGPGPSAAGDGPASDPA
jgi:CelD/BcsL family acetyltransferase involved in cellulose biosynthesis